MSCLPLFVDPVDHIKLLFEQELYSNVVAAANLLLTASDHCPDVFNCVSKFQMYVYYADSLYNLGQYRKAEGVYRQALQFKKSMLKSKTAATPKPYETAVKELSSDIDIKYKIYLCHEKLREHDQAMDILQSVPGKQRTVKINMALAKLYHQGGLERSAITGYKEVLRECPLALEAAEGLLSLGVSGVEVNSMVVQFHYVSGIMEWFPGWIKAHALTHSREYPQAIAAFKHLDERTPLRGNHILLVNLGELYYYQGDNRNALLTLQRAHAVDPTMQKGLDILAAVLASDRRTADLEQLVTTSWNSSEHAPEVWTALSYLLYTNGTLTRAAYPAQKACFLSPRNVEALVLKGTILYDLKKYQDAAAHFREAFQVAPYRYEPHRGLVDCYVAMHRLREAVTIASNACKQLNNAPRALTLYASVLMKDPVTVCKAKTLLEKALAQDETYLPAVYLLTEILEQEMNLETAVALLEKQAAINPTCKLHQMLGDLHSRLDDEQKAIEYYHHALNLDPHNQRAMEGLQRLHSSSSFGSRSSPSETSYYNNMSDVNPPDSDHEGNSEISVD